MPKMTTKKTEYKGPHFEGCEDPCKLTERAHQGPWLKLRKCPKCKTRGRLLAGPDYDRWRLACMNCGHRFRLTKPPEGFTE